MISPSISIIVPVYNVEPYLRRCLDSLIGQTLREIEIICVDDGSTDGSDGILAAYAEREPRVRVISQANVGQAAARNRALEVARTPYIMFCDSDDWYEPNMCEKMLAALEAYPEAEVAICGYYSEWERAREEWENSNIIEKVELVGYHRLTVSVIRKCVEVPWNKIYRREIIEKNQLRFPEGLRFEDFFFWHIVAAHSKGVVFVQEQLYHYRLRMGSTMQKSYTGDIELNLDYLHIASRLWEYFKVRHMLKLRDGYIAELWALMIWNILRYSNVPEIHAHTIRYVHSFVAAESKANKGCVPPLVFKALMMPLGIPSVRTKRLGGLLHIRCSLKQITIRLCGIQIYQIRRDENTLRRYVLGMPYSRLQVESSPEEWNKGKYEYYSHLYAPYIPHINTTYALNLELTPDHRKCMLKNKNYEG